MVLVNLCKLLLLIQCIQDCPHDVPKRNQKLFDAYYLFKATSDDLVSVEVNAELESPKERKLDDEDDQRRKKILENIIKIYTESNFEFPPNSNTIYLIPPINSCINCHCNLVTVRPDRRGRGILIYTKEGPRMAQVFHKYCNACSCKAYYCYSEFEVDGILMREYHTSPTKYFSVTQDTFFKLDLLEDLTEDVCTSDVRFVRWTEKYNRIYNNQETKLVKNRVFPAWILYSINKRVPLRFNVIRKSDRQLDLDEVCKEVYPALKTHIDKKWLSHICKRCETRLVVMDGNAKVWRNN